MASMPKGAAEGREMCMKPYARRLLGLLGGAIIAVTATPSLIAHAETGPDFDNVSANGTTFFNPPIPLIGGVGAWNFQSSGPCAAVSGGVEVSGSEIIETGTTCNVTGNGTYASVVCMNLMTIAGSFSVSVHLTQPFVVDETWTTTFTAVIQNGSGAINGVSTEGLTSDGDSDGPWTTTGHISYTPTQGNCVTAPVSAAFTSLSLNVAEQ
jgi:hypothetical protein